ncbi:MAG: MFS transporter [Gemmatimonadota bacterium]
MKPPKIEANLATASRWTTIGLLAGLALVSYVERSNIAVAANYIKPEFGLTDIQMGRVFSSFLIGYSLFQIPAGRMGDRFGPRLVLALAALSWGLMTLLTGLLPGIFVSGTLGILWTFLVLRFLLGVGEAATFPVAARAIANWMRPTERGRANAYVIAGVSLGSTITPPLTALVMVRLGWRASFYVASSLAFAFALIWWVVARDRAPTASGPVAREPAPGAGESTVSWWRLFGNRNIVLLSLSYFVGGYILYIFVFWLYTYLVDVRHFSVLRSGVFSSMPWIVAAVLTPVGGILSDHLVSRWGESTGRRVVAMTGLALSGLFLLYGAMAANPYLAIAGLSLAVGFEEFTEGSFWAATINVAGPHAGAATGILNMMGNLGGVASTALVPILVHRFGWVVALGSGSVLAVLGALLWLGIDARARLDAGAVAEAMPE